MELDLSALLQCTNCITLRSQDVQPSGNQHADIMFILHAPTHREYEEQNLMVGPIGELLELVLDEAGLQREDVYITSIVKCHPPGNRDSHPEESSNCANTWLKKELSTINPKIVVILGAQAHEVIVKGKFPYEHLYVNKGAKRIYVTSHHPGHFLRANKIDQFIKLGSLLKQLLQEANAVR